MGGGSKKATIPRTPAPPPPLGAWHLWRWFGEIVSGEPSGFGPAVITWAGLQAWASFMRVELEPWEARALVALGNARARVLTEDDAPNKSAADK